ncbi:MAG: MerR family DNA-binding transcriptional regulator [Hyphomicrobiaceae bacterium]|nr:MerR family DNA-binding transcriptional regulator [Hyphomicrobiaceae bacterium]
MPNSEKSLYSIAELAREFAISTRTIRFYEAKGLIAPNRVGGTRVFSRRDRARLMLILRGKRLGFSLREISDYLGLYDADPAQKSQVELLHNLVSQRLDKLEQQQRDLTTTIRELREIRQQAEDQLADARKPARSA